MIGARYRIIKLASTSEPDVAFPSTRAEGWAGGHMMISFASHPSLLDQVGICENVLILVTTGEPRFFLLNFGGVHFAAKPDMIEAVV